MKRALLILSCLVLICILGAAAIYASYGGPDDLNERIENGDIVFQTTSNEQSAAIMAATGSLITHMGIAVKDKAGNVSIIETGAIVRTVPLKDWIAKGQAGRVAVKRYHGLDGAKAKRIVATAASYKGAAYDPYFYMDDRRLYCSELVYKAYDANGIQVGKLETLADLNTGNDFTRELIEKRIDKHPLCSKESKGCWEKIRAEKIVTPVSIYKDKSLDTVYSNYVL